MTTYDFSGYPLSPHNGERITKKVNGVDEPQTVLDCIIISLEMPASEREVNSKEGLAYRRKIVKKLKNYKLAGQENAVSLQSKTIEEIKDRVVAYFMSGVAMQIIEAIEGEPTQAQLDDI